MYYLIFYSLYSVWLGHLYYMGVIQIFKSLFNILDLIWIVNENFWNKKRYSFNK